MRIEPLDGVSFGALVHDVVLTELDERTFGELHEAWLDRALLIFPGQHLTKAEQNDFARRFGDLEFEAAPISNMTSADEVISDPGTDLVKSLRGNEGWHHDSTYMPVQAKGAVFTAEIVPSEGAATGWADMRAAFDSFDDDLKARLEQLQAFHSLWYSMDRAGYLPQTKNESGGYDMYGYHELEHSLRPMVKVHPETGRANLLLGRHAHSAVGLAPDESERFIDDVNEQAIRPEWVHHHQWDVGDAVVWDNRRLMHRGTPYDMTEPRRMWHTRIAGEADTELALNFAGVDPADLDHQRQPG